MPDIVDLCTKKFIHDEPHSKALGMTAEASKGLFEYIVSKALHYPYSYRIHEKRTHIAGNEESDWIPPFIYWTPRSQLRCRTDRFRPIHSSSSNPPL
ncbi:unnamed protein product [Strongylus vulgaris]|uniref:Uncharacterized protein n=1 Tax=Strongylus vulgaris TaxID=40348 RepID=A0A3P7HZE2_STRVU|nr:unnamed protein product [Strongylus vulgaris]